MNIYLSLIDNLSDFYNSQQIEKTELEINYLVFINFLSRPLNWLSLRLPIFHLYAVNLIQVISVNWNRIVLAYIQTTPIDALTSWLNLLQYLKSVSDVAKLIRFISGVILIKRIHIYTLKLLHCFNGLLLDRLFAIDVVISFVLNLWSDNRIDAAFIVSINILYIYCFLKISNLLNIIYHH